jgi:bacterial/archaeal transporter family protein
MNWLPYALLSAAVYTCVNFVDKYVVTREIRDFRGMVIYSTITSFLVGMVLWIITGFPTLPLHDLVLIMLSGMITIWGAAMYFKAMSTEDASTVIVLLQMTPIFVLVLAVVFLREGMSPQQMIGFVLILLAAVGISLQKSAQKFRLSSSFALIALVCFINACSFIMVKFVSESSKFEQFVAYESWGLSVGGALLYLFMPGVRGAFHDSLRTVRRRAIAIVFVNETLFVVAKLLGFLAITLGPVALVSVVNSVQVFMGIALGWILTTLIPSIYQENTSREGLTRKVAFASILFAGVWLVS